MSWPSPRVLASGLGFPEGPVYCGDGVVVLVDIKDACLWRHAGGHTSQLASVPGGPNGACRSRDGSFFVARNGGLTVGPGGYWFSSDFGDGGISRVKLSDVSNICDLSAAEEPRRPNDICFGPDGALYFTDPANWEDFAHLKPGRVWRASVDGKASVFAEVPSFPNGIAFGPDGRLYVAQTLTQTILVFDWSPAGLGAPAAFCKLPTGFPDGFAFAANGDLYVCGSMGDVMHVFSAAGELKESVEFPEHSEPTNCCFGDGTLYVTCSSSGELVAFDLGVEGYPLFD